MELNQLMYKGRHVEEMTREELIEALYAAANHIKSIRQMALAENEMWADLTKAALHR